MSAGATAMTATQEAPDALAELIGIIGAEEVTWAVTLFRESAREGLAAMRAALPGGDLGVIRHHAHALKSSSLLLGAEQLSALLARLEAGAVAGRHQELHALVAELPALVDQSLERMERTLRG